LKHKAEIESVIPLIKTKLILQSIVRKFWMYNAVAEQRCCIVFWVAI
jgi:hypothetical protein